MQRNDRLGSVLHDISINTDPNLYQFQLIELVDAIRKMGMEGVTTGIRYVVAQLDGNVPLQDSFSRMFEWLFNRRDCHTLFTESGILTGSGFSQQMFRQMKDRILPPVTDKHSMAYLLQKTFHKRDDYKWVEAVPDYLWKKLFSFINLGFCNTESPLHHHLINAVTILSYRISFLGLEEDINRHFINNEFLITPFLDQNRKVQRLILLNRTTGCEEINELANSILEDLEMCLVTIQTIRNRTHKFGTSLEQTYLLLRTEQQIERIRYIVNLFATNDDADAELAHSVNFFKEVIRSECRRDNISDLFRKNIGLLAYQIAEHKGNTGEHYITSNRKEYFQFLYAAMGGGAIISFIAMFKTLLHHAPVAPFWEYFFYGLNYAIGFLLLQFTHTTLATKQPAMTASTLASYLDFRKRKNSLQHVARAFVLVWRSQTASFVGNLIVVFPLSYILAHIYLVITGNKLVEGEQAQSYLDNQNPMLSAAWLYACFTGVFLFLSGIVTGYVDNKVRFGNYEGRIMEHPLLTRFVKAEKRKKIAKYLDENLGGMAGNVFLGFCLGFAPVIGKIFGIPFDIRHITISTAQFAFGLYGLDNQVPARELVSVIVGVLGIGFFNFLVSFGLAFWVALRSRNLHIWQIRGLGSHIFRYFLMYPFDFVFPPNKRVHKVKSH